MFFKIIITLFITVGVSIAATAQHASVLPHTVLFKLKEDYRSLSSSSDIDNEVFHQIANKIGVSSLDKVFPNKQKERIAENIDLSLIYELRYSNNFTEQQVVKMLEVTSMFEYVQEYPIPQLCYTPNDTDFVDQYYLNLINAPGAWDINKGDTNVVIGITDSGWEPSHLDLQANIKLNYADPINGVDDDADGYIDNYRGWDLGNNDNDATYESLSHGVHVTGIAAAVTDNVTGVAGVGFNTRFLPIKISNPAGVFTKAYQGIVYAADHGCFIINCSWGDYVKGNFQQDVVNYALNKGCLIIAGAGNNSTDDLFYPAAFDGVIAVAASDQSDTKASFSNYGDFINITAPGVSIFNTLATAYGYNDGTSMSSPMVAGGAALIKAQYPTYNNYQVAAVLKTTATNIDAQNPSYINKLGTGRLDLFNALTATGLQNVEITSKSITDNNNNTFEIGDTLEIIKLFTNYLDATNNLTATLTTTNSNVSVLNSSSPLINLNTLDTTSNYLSPFKVKILSGATFNEVVEFKVTLSNGVYSSNYYFDVVVNPNYLNVAINQVATSISANGKIGYNDINNSVGLGFTYQGEQILAEAGFLIGDGATRVADCIRGSVGQDQDFNTTTNVYYKAPYLSDIDVQGYFNDSPLTSAMQLNIKHTAYAYQNAPDDKYIIVAYDIENVGPSTLNNIYAGLFADWNLLNGYQNRAAYDAAQKMGYIYSYTDSIYAAIKLLSPGVAFNYALDNIAGGAGVIDITDGFDTAEKYAALSNNRFTSGSFNVDVSHVVSTGDFSLVAGEHKRIAFALIAGDSLSDIQNSGDAAQAKYLADGISVEELTDKNIFNIYPIPSTGIINIKSAAHISSVLVKNVLGELVLKKLNTNMVDLSGFPNGVYFLNVSTKHSQATKKIIISR